VAGTGSTTERARDARKSGGISISRWSPPAPAFSPSDRLAEIDSGNVEEMVSSSSLELLEEIRFEGETIEPLAGSPHRGRSSIGIR